MAQNPFLATVPWEQNPMFLAAINLNTPPGGPYSYVVPRPTGNSPSDVTAFHIGQATWSAANPPAILYQFEPTAEWKVFKTSRLPPQRRDFQGSLVWERWPKPGINVQPLLDYAILPDQIGTQEGWWYLEAVRRLDPRILWRDILMRMERLGSRQKNTLNQEAVRARTEFSMLSWFPRATISVINARLDGLLRSLTVTQIAANTTRGSTPASFALQAKEGNHKLSPRTPTPKNTLITFTRYHEPRPGSGYTPEAGREEVDGDVTTSHSPNLDWEIQGEVRKSHAHLYEGSNEGSHNFGRYQREAKGRERGGIRVEYAVNGGIDFTPGVEMLPPALYNPSFPPVSEVGSRQGEPLWSLERVEYGYCSQQPQLATPYQLGTPSFRPRMNLGNLRKFDSVRAHQTKPSPSLASRSFKRVYDEPKQHTWIPRASNHTPFAKARRAAIITSAQADRPLRNAEDSSFRTFGRPMPNEANATERRTNTGSQSTDLRGSFENFFHTPNSQGIVQVPLGRNAAIPTPSTGDTTNSETWLPSSVKQKGSVPIFEFDSFFDMNAYQNS